LFHTAFGHRAGGVRGVHAFLLHRRGHRPLRQFPVHALGQEVPNDAAGPPPAGHLGPRERFGEPAVVDDAAPFEPGNGLIHRVPPVLLLEETAPEIPLGMGPEAFQADSRLIRPLHLRQHVQRTAEFWSDFRAQGEAEGPQGVIGEGRETPPIHFHHAVAGAARIGGTSGADGHYSSAAGASSSAAAPAGPAFFIPSTSFTFASISSAISGWSFRYILAF